MTATVVLVHGAMHTPWIYGPLRERLDARGIPSQRRGDGPRGSPGMSVDARKAWFLDSVILSRNPT